MRSKGALDDVAERLEHGRRCAGRRTPCRRGSARAPRKTDFRKASARSMLPAQVAEGHLGLHHPELGQVAAGVRVLGAEGGTEGVDVAERQRRDLGLELARHGEEGLAPKKSCDEVHAAASRKCAGRIAGSRVETRNSSPAPSASDAVMMGECSRMKPRSWKKSWIARAAALRTRSTAPSVLVRGRRCAMVRRNSKLCRFFCSG